MGSHFGTLFDTCAKALRERLPTEHQVRIRATPSSHLVAYHEEAVQADCGWCGEGKDAYLIVRISEALGEQAAIATLAHEYAHAMVLSSTGPSFNTRKFHGRAWGVAFSKSYGVVYGVS